MLYFVNAPKPSSRAKSRRAVKAARKAAKRSKAGGASGTRPSKGSKARPTSTAHSQARRNGGMQMAAKKKGRKPAAKKSAPKRRRRKTARKSPVQRLGRGKVYVTNGRKRTRRYRRNPSLGGGIGSTLMRAGKDAIGVVAGVALTNLIARRIPFGEGNRAAEIGKKLVVALGLGVIAKRAVGSAMAEKLVVGGVVAVANDLLAAVPVVGPALSGDDMIRAASLGAYASGPALPSGMGAYVEVPYMSADSGAGYRS